MVVSCTIYGVFELNMGFFLTMLCFAGSSSVVPTFGDHLRLFCRVAKPHPPHSAYLYPPLYLVVQSPRSRLQIAQNGSSLLGRETPDSEVRVSALRNH